MAIANVSLTDTYSLWLTRFNQSLVAVNALTEGQANSTGTLTITNPSYVNGNTTLNISNGVVQIQGYRFISNTISFKSNSSTLTVSGTGTLGSNVYFDVGTLSTDIFDSSTANIASANTVNKAYVQGNNAYNFANTVNVRTIAAFTQANTVNTQSIAAFDKANTADTQSIAAFNQANTVNTQSIAAFAKANAALPNTTGTFSGSLTLTTDLYVPTGNILIGATGAANANFEVLGNYSLARANTLSQTLTDQATIAWDTSKGQVATVTLGASRIMGAPTNLKVGTYILHVIQGGSGSYTITWNAVFKWPSAVAPTLSTTVGRRDVMSFVSDGTNLYGTYINDVR